MSGSHEEKRESQKEVVQCTSAYMDDAHNISCYASDWIRSPVLASNSVLMSTSAIGTFAWSPTSCSNPGSHIFSIWVLPFLPSTLMLACMHPAAHSSLHLLMSNRLPACWSASYDCIHISTCLVCLPLCPC